MKLSHCFLISFIVVSSVHVSHVDAMNPPSPLRPRELFPSLSRKDKTAFLLAQRDLTDGIMTVHDKRIASDIATYVEVFGTQLLIKPHYYGQKEPIATTMLAVAQKANNQAAINALAIHGVR